MHSSQYIMFAEFTRNSNLKTKYIYVFRDKKKN